MPSFQLGTNAKPSSRSLGDLHPEMGVRLTALFARYKEKYPNASQPMVDSTYRNPADQNADFHKVPKVTNAQAGQSLHNYYPSLAFDVFFEDTNGKPDWNPANFTNLGALAPSVDLNWGGSWHSFQDRPHFQPANGGMLYRWEDAHAGKEPVWGALSNNGTEEGNPAA